MIRPPRTMLNMRDTISDFTDACQLQSKAAQTMKRPVSSKISMHFSIKVSSKASSSASDIPAGGNTLIRPSSSSYRMVFASTFASGHSFFASKVSSVSFWSRVSRCVSAALSFFTANDLLGSVDEVSRPPGRLAGNRFLQGRTEKRGAYSGFSRGGTEKLANQGGAKDAQEQRPNIGM